MAAQPTDHIDWSIRFHDNKVNSVTLLKLLQQLESYNMQLLYKSVKRHVKLKQTNKNEITCNNHKIYFVTAQT
jgi:hypothetical protein